MNKPSVRKGWMRRRVSIDEFGPSMTVASEAPATEISYILNAHARGAVVSFNSSTPCFGDTTSVPDYMEAMNIVVKAREQFDSLPSNIRRRFNEDPAEFLAFCSDDKNHDEALKLGICKPAEQAITAQNVSPENPPISGDNLQK